MNDYLRMKWSSKYPKYTTTQKNLEIWRIKDLYSL